MRETVPERGAGSRDANNPPAATRDRALQGGRLGWSSGGSGPRGPPCIRGAQGTGWVITLLTMPLTESPTDAFSSQIAMFG